MSRSRRRSTVNEESRLDYAAQRPDGAGPDALDVMVVDGEYVRRHIDVDFTMGGNPSRYSYVPHGELWVERILETNDTISTIVHEAIEHRLMKNAGLSYADAHAAANQIDADLRAAIEKRSTGYVRAFMQTPKGTFVVTVPLGDDVIDPNSVVIEARGR